jgi:hypothetical protein
MERYRVQLLNTVQQLPRRTMERTVTSAFVHIQNIGINCLLSTHPHAVKFLVPAFRKCAYSFTRNVYDVFARWSLPDPALEISETIQDTQSTIPDSQTRSSTRFLTTRSMSFTLWPQLDNKPHLNAIRAYRPSFFLCFRFWQCHIQTKNYE